MIPRTRTTPIERFAGVAPQFVRTEGGYLFRRDLWGPAIRVTVAERDAFARAGLWSAGIHGAVLVGLVWTARLLIKRTLGSHGEIAVAVAFGVVGSLVTMAVYASMRWHADAPHRALAGRPHERPALQPQFDASHSYGMILGATLILLFMAATGTRGSTGFYVSFATASLMLGVFLILRRWLFEADMTREQRARARAAVMVQHPGDPGGKPVDPLAVWRIVLVFVFLLLEFAAMGAGIVAGLSLAEGLSGEPSHDLSLVPGVIGGVAALGTAALGVWLLERLCIRLTFQSAFGILKALPADW